MDSIEEIIAHLFPEYSEDEKIYQTKPIYLGMSALMSAKDLYKSSFTPTNNFFTNILNGVNFRITIIPPYNKFTGYTMKLDENDFRHCSDGPAIVTFDGKTKMWYYHGTHVSHFVEKWADDCGVNLRNMTDDDKDILRFNMALFVK